MTTPEVKIVTVPHELVNDTIRLRQAFGWTVISTAARSFATHADAAFLGVGGANVLAGGGRVAMHNVHFVDLTLQRTPSPRNLQLAQLELEYEAAEIRGLPRLGWNLAGWLLGGYLAAVLVAVVALEAAPQAIAWGVGATVGLAVTVLLVIGWRRNQAKVAQTNRRSLETRHAILHRIGLRNP